MMILISTNWNGKKYDEKRTDMGFMSKPQQTMHIISTNTTTKN